MQRPGGANRQNTLDWDNYTNYLNESLLEMFDTGSNDTDLDSLISKHIEWGGEEGGETLRIDPRQKEFLISSQFWIAFVLTPICFIIGVFCNAASIKIFAKRSMRSSTNVYLMALAVSDLLHHVFSFTMSWKYYPFMGTVWLYWWYTPFGLWIIEASQSTSIFIIVALTIERCVGVFNPLKRQTYCTEERALYGSKFIFLICFGITGIFSYDWRVAVQPIDGKPLNETVYTLDTTEAWEEDRYQKAYHWISTIYFYLVPAMVIAVFNYFLVQFVRNFGETQEVMIAPAGFAVSHRQQNDNKITMIVIAVGIIYIICQMPTNLLIIYTLAYKPTVGSTEESILLELRDIFKLLGLISSTCNILLYMVLNKNYRKYFWGACYRQRQTNFYVNAFRSPKICLRAGFHPTDGSVEISNIVDGRY